MAARFQQGALGTELKTTDEGLAPRPTRRYKPPSRPATTGSDPPPLVPRRQRWPPMPPSALCPLGILRRLRGSTDSESQYRGWDRISRSTWYTPSRHIPPSRIPLPAVWSLTDPPLATWNRGEASPAHVQNRGTPPENGRPVPSSTILAKLRVPIFPFLLLHATPTAPRLPLHWSLTLFCSSPQPNARYPTSHLGLSIAPQNPSSTIGTLQSFFSSALHRSLVLIHSLHSVVTRARD